eukprot:3717302-Pleurochrysis_carterae.AAC.1
MGKHHIEGVRRGLVDRCAKVVPNASFKDHRPHPQKTTSLEASISRDVTSTASSANPLLRLFLGEGTATTKCVDRSPNLATRARRQH